MNISRLSKLFPRRLQFQAGLTVSVLLCTTIGGYAWLTAREQSDATLNAIRDQTTVLAKSVANLSINYLLVEDFATMQTLLLRIAEFPHVLSLSVTDKKGMVLSRVVHAVPSLPRVDFAPERLNPPAGEEPVLAADDGKLVVWYPIQEGTLFGWVKLEYDLRVIADLKRRIGQDAFLAALLVATVSIAVIMLFLHRPIGAVRKLTDFAKRLNDVRGTTVEVEPGTAEIEQLALALNSASVKLYEQERAGKQAEEALRESEKKYRTLFEESKDAIFFDTADGKILDLNPAGRELFGITGRDDLSDVDVGRDVYVNPDDREVLKQVLERRGYVKDYEAKFKKKDGEAITVLITATAVSDGSGRIAAYRGTIRDVTSERRLEEQLRHAQKMEAVGQLTGGIAHDFNNILSAIISYGYLLQSDLEKDSPQQSYVVHMLASAERAANLTRSLLAFSRKQIMNPKPLELNHVIKTVEKLLSKVISEDIELRTVLSAEELRVVADSGQLEQVLMNFATNARDAMPRGGSFTIQTERVELGAGFIRAHGYGQLGSYACVAATDSGAGMDEKTVKRIFEPFFTTKEVGKGTGLGLSIVYGIVKQHNGYINAYSEPGMGTTFKVYLPLCAVRCEEEMPATPSSAALGGAETILIAEDDEDLRKLARIVLRKFGYTLIEAKDGEEAVEKFRQHRDAVDLVVLDVIMPKKNGKDAYEEIKKIRPGVKALFTSGYTADIMHQRGILEEGLHFVSKPIMPDVLLRKVREVLDS